jgi:hypothetical protein
MIVWLRLSKTKPKDRNNIIREMRGGKQALSQKWPRARARSFALNILRRQLALTRAVPRRGAGGFSGSFWAKPSRFSHFLHLMALNGT